MPKESTIQHYTSSTTGSVPTSGNLASGELAINTADEKIFYKNHVGTVLSLSETKDLSGAFAASSKVVSSFNGATGAVTFTVPLATTSLTGTASFNPNRFQVSATGNVDLLAAYQATGDTVITVAGSGIGIVTSGNTDTLYNIGVTAFNGATGAVQVTGSGAILSTVSGTTTTLGARLATTSVTGVASFAAADFTVSSGAVSLTNAARTNAANTFTGLQTFSNGITSIGATFGGNIAVNGGDITTTATAATLYNTNATTIAIGSSAGSVTVSSGNTSGMTFGMGFYHKFKTNRVGTLTTLQTEIFRFNYKNASLSVVGGLDAAYAEIIITAEKTPGFGACFGTQITKLLIASNPADVTVFHTEYGNVNTNGNLASYTASISGNDVIIYATPTSSDYTIFKVLATLIRGEFGEGI